MKTKIILGMNLLVAVAAAQRNPAPTTVRQNTEAKVAVQPAGMKKAQGAESFTSLKERYSYALGVDLANQLKMGTVDLDPEQFSVALKSVLSGDMPVLNSEEVHTAIVELQAEIKRKKLNPSVLAPDAALKAGQDFLKGNKAREGVVALPSGLQYRIMKAGDGKKPEDGDTITVHYRGTMLDGAEFDSSYARGYPLTMPLNDSITGWKEGLKLIAVGSKVQLFIPANLAYGETGSLPRIGPNSTLIFEIDLLASKQ